MTPMMQQLKAAREQYPGMLVFFQNGEFYELFGDRGRFLGNPLLRPETALGWDAGLSFDAAPARARVLAEVSAFDAGVDDLIVAIPSQRATTVVNVAGARNRGVELLVALRLPRPRLSLDATYTFLDARDRATELRVPGRPAHL